MDAFADFERRVGVHHPYLGLVRKTATAPTEYSDDWRNLRPLSDRFMDFLRPQSGLGQMAGAVRRVPANVPTLAQQTASSAVWAGQAKPISVSAALDLDPKVLPLLKLGLIAITTQELAKSTDSGAITIIERDLANSVAVGEDAVLFSDAAAVTNVSPAGILHGITPVGSASPADLEADVTALLLALRSGQPLAPFFIVSPAGALNLATLRNSGGARVFPNVTLTGGDILGVPVIVSAGAGSNLIALDASALLVVDEGVELSSAAHGSVQLDTAPDDPPTSVRASGSANYVAEPVAAKGRSGLTSAAISIIASSLAPVIKELLKMRDDRIAALEARVVELEQRPELKWAGIFDPMRAYAAGSLVTRSGSLWLATALTAQQPGSSADWKLICKQGRVE